MAFLHRASHEITTGASKSSTLCTVRVYSSCSPCPPPGPCPHLAFFLATCPLCLPKVLQSVLDQYRVPPELFAKVCIIVDKVDKLPREQIEKELAALGVVPDIINGERRDCGVSRNSAAWGG